MVHVIAASRKGYENFPQKLSKLLNQKFVLINRKEELTFEQLRVIKSRYVFLPHWSYLVPENVYENYECIIFHMTDVPFGRGGSPLQNLISNCRI